MTAVNFNIYVDKQTATRLQRLAKTRRMTRNALIREALARLLDRDVQTGWPEAVLEFKGVPDWAPFEEARRGLEEPRRDPLA